MKVVKSHFQSNFFSFHSTKFNVLAGGAVASLQHLVGGVYYQYIFFFHFSRRQRYKLLATWPNKFKEKSALSTGEALSLRSSDLRGAYVINMIYCTFWLHTFVTVVAVTSVTFVLNFFNFGIWNKEYIFQSLPFHKKLVTLLSIWLQRSRRFSYKARH